MRVLLKDEPPIGVAILRKKEGSHEKYVLSSEILQRTYIYMCVDIARVCKTIRARGLLVASVPDTTKFDPRQFEFSNVILVYEVYKKEIYW